MTDWRAIYSLGFDFTHFQSYGHPGEKANVEQIIAQLSAPQALSPNTYKRIAALNKPARLLVAAEMWCPDCQRNVTAFNTLCALTPHIEMRLITHSRAERELKKALNLSKIAIPLAVVLDEQFMLLGTFNEMPRQVIAGDEKMLARYRANQELESAITDILDILKSAN